MDDFTPSQLRGLELMHKMMPILNGEEANAVNVALCVTLGALVAKHCRSEEEAVKLCTAISGDITRHALEFMGGDHGDV
jgi:hypothetical protein